MDLLDQFKKTRTFKIYYSTLFRFDESLNCFVSTEKWRNQEAEQLNAAWRIFAEVAESQTVPEWAVIVPKLSANYLFNTVPQLGFKDKDEKDTVLYHLNYMASEFKAEAKRFVEQDHAKQQAMIKEALGKNGMLTINHLKSVGLIAENGAELAKAFTNLYFNQAANEIAKQNEGEALHFMGSVAGHALSQMFSHLTLDQLDHVLAQIRSYVIQTQGA
jgi:hypothetical protein